jgi:2-amino-4-hydroxy-6-hydroxymethyldihydropteridine diphosphokinase
MGPQDQDDFVNAVIAIQTTLDVKSLLHALQAIENKMGRVRIQHWGPRIIDLDLLLYDDLVYQDFELTLPHPGVFDRIFFLQPLHDIAPNLCLPDGRAIASLFKPALTAISNNAHA